MLGSNCQGQKVSSQKEIVKNNSMDKSKPNLYAPVKKHPVGKREKLTHLPTYSITCCCVCGTKFETTSASPQSFSVSSCSQCNPFYTGVAAQEIRVGAVAKFRQKFESKKKS
jgi:large subunit ribosomal protein L31